jgi:folate-dependent tRNA-U54 methylase TrmFO/GidA
VNATVVGGGLAGSEAAWALAERGVRVTSRGTLYISAAHTEADIEDTLDRAESALGAVI